jgi:FkbM family methyltransferase
MSETNNLKPLLSDQKRALLARMLNQQPKQTVINFYSQFLGDGDLCFDVGANVGNRTAIFTKLGASVVAVEPQTQCIELLKKLYGSNANVHVLQKAVGDKEGQAELSVSNFSTVSSLSQEWREGFKEWESPNAAWDGTEIVEVTTLDHIIEQYGVPKFIKIDVEGYECQVIKGLSQPIPALSFEFHTFLLDAARDCVRLLSELGNCVLNYTVEDQPAFILDQWLPSSQLIDELARLENRPPWYGEIFARFLL